MHSVGQNKTTTSLRQGSKAVFSSQGAAARRRDLIRFGAVLFLATATFAGLPKAHCQDPAGSASRFVASWATSEQAPEPQNHQPGLPDEDLTDVTIREIVHLSVGGNVVRLHLSNAFGTQPLRVGSVHLAKPVSPATANLAAGQDVPVLFAGRPDVVIPAGAEYVSDPVPFQVAPLSNLSISLYLPTAPAGQTLHPGAHAVSYLAHGMHVSDADLPGAKREEHWYQLASVDVSAGPQARAVVCFGDSITDGHASTTNGNDRWTDFLAARLQASSGTHSLAVVNEGIGGNHLLTDGLGENALGRFDRDVLAPSGVSTVIVFEGINDIGMLARGKVASAQEHAELVTRMIAAYQQIIARGHAHGLKVYGATMTPFAGSDYYRPTAANEADRVAVNHWILTSGKFDGVVDFDATVRDPNQPDHLLPAADSGDHLHPGPTGYKMLGNAVPMAWFGQ